MSEPTWERVKRIFDETAGLPPSERAAALERLCGGDARLYAEVEALLVSHDELRAYGPDTLTREEGAAASEEAGSTIGRYKLLQPIGEGGFGVVYMAEQEQPVRRRVALKIIKLGMDTKQVIARFEAERQALALMEHPNIAKVLDAGATEAGRPYFVMELVRGIPITDYCDRNKLSTRKRLELFMAVCGAVQHAHQKGVIHRDIKPSNVMVTLHDGTPVPKIIDFGIAKATNQRLTERTLFTEYNQFIGTPAYMSPEQAEMSGLDVDTRSDIYSLGVLLYELLTGTTPLDAHKLGQVAYSEIQRMIREDEPHRPSVRISTLGGAASQAAQHRQTDLPGLARLLRGDLDWVVMKALEKDRTRRYETANGMRMDIRRYLANEPVSASPPGTLYRLRKFVRRNRTAVTVAATVIAALVGGLLLAGAGLLQARREAAASQAINGFFSDMLASVDPLRLREHSGFTPESGAVVETAAGLSQDISVAEMMLRARGRIESSFRGKPGLEATVCETIGLSLFGLGRPREAAEEFDRAAVIRRAAFGLEHPATIRSELQLGAALTDGGRAPESILLLEAVREKSERLYGDSDPRTLMASSLLGNALAQDRRHREADPIFREALERQREIVGAEHRDTLRTMRWWAGSRHWRGDGAGGEELSRPAYEAALRTLGPDDELTLELQNVLGWSRNFQGDREEGEALLRPAVEGLARILGEGHPTTCEAQMGLGRSLDADERGDEKERLWTEALDCLRSSEGPTSPTVYVISRDLAFLLLRRGKTEESLHLLRRAVDEFRQAYGEDHGWTRDNMNYLARGLRRVGRDEEALSISRRVLELNCRAAGQPGADAAALNRCAWNLLTWDPAELRDDARALPLAEQAVALAEGDLEPLVRDTLALALHRNGRHQEAVEAQRSALAWFPDENEAKRSYIAALVRYLAAAGSEQEAIDVITDWVAELAANGKSAEEFVRAVGKIADPLAKGLPKLAEEAHRRALRVVRERWPDDAPAMTDVLSDIGRTLIHQGRFDEAEAVIRESVTWAKGSDEAIAALSRGQLLLAMARAHQGDPGEARRLATEVTQRYAESDGGQIEREAQRLLGYTHLATGDPRGAEPLLRGVVDWYRESGFNDPWRRARAEGEWGACLVALKRFDEAEPLVLHSRKVLDRELGKDSTFSREAEQRVARLYEAWGRPRPTGRP